MGYRSCSLDTMPEGGTATATGVNGDGSGSASAIEGRAQASSGKHLPGEVGVWVFILGDLMVFALLFGVYLYYRIDDPALFASSQSRLNQAFGAVNTLLLLTSSLLVVTAVRALRHGVTNIAPELFAGAMACGAGFAVLKIFEYSGKISEGLVPATNEFWMYYFILTGLHFFHLLLGMAVLTFCLVSSRMASLSAQRFSLVEGGACFWHMVDLLWVVLFPLLYLA